MSTNYRVQPGVHICDLLDGRLEQFGIKEHVCSNMTETMRCLTDGACFLWFHIDSDSYVRGLIRYYPNHPEHVGRIVGAIQDRFNVDIVCEHEPQYWGFETQEEWDAAWERMHKESQDEQYLQIMRYVRGEPNSLAPGTNEIRFAEIAAKLVSEDPGLLLPANREKLEAEIWAIYQREERAQLAKAGLF